MQLPFLISIRPPNHFVFSPWKSLHLVVPCRDTIFSILNSPTVFLYIVYGTRSKVENRAADIALALLSAWCPHPLSAQIKEAPAAIPLNPALSTMLALTRFWPNTSKTHLSCSTWKEHFCAVDRASAKDFFCPRWGQNQTVSNLSFAAGTNEVMRMIVARNLLQV